MSRISSAGTANSSGAAGFLVRCVNGMMLRLSSPVGTADKTIDFNHDDAGAAASRRWQVRATGEAETGANAGTNFQVARYDDTGTLLDNPIIITRSSGNVTLTPGIVCRRASSTTSNLSLNTFQTGGGGGIFAIGNAATVPNANPAGGGVLYAEAGALKWRGSNGTITTIAPA